MIALDQNITPEPESTKVDGELAGVGDGIEVGCVDRREAFVDLEEGPTAGRLEQRHTEDRQVGEVQGRRTDPQRAGEQPAEVLDVPEHSSKII